MRVLFLDIDGVLNSHDYVQRADWRPPLGSDRDVQLIDPSAVALLNEVVAATKAHAVISSSWRRTYSVDALRRILEQRGFRGHIVGATPALPTQRRSQEIATWIAANADVRALAIVDDDPDAGFGHETHFVQTTFETGLMRVHAEHLVRILTAGGTLVR